MTSSATSVEAVVVGAGVVGLAVARALAIRGKEVLLLDRACRIGSETSSRNSQVVHAGLYYPTDSLKAKFCVEGRNMLYDFCKERSIPFQKVGKLIVATDKQQAQTTLRQLQEQAIHNGVTDVRLIDRHDVKAMEPEVESCGALWSPSTGIVDSHDFMVSLLADAQEHGTTLALVSDVSDGSIDKNGKVQLKIDDMWLSCGMVINCAGLWSHQVADLIHAEHSWKPPRQYFAKGTYFQLQGTSPFSHLIYPVPDQRGGLGVHATVDMGGQVKFGPDVEWLDLDMEPDAIDWAPDPARAQSFYQSIRKYWPGLVDDSLVPDYTGVRPKLSHPDLVESMPFQDFMLVREDTHGVPGLVHLLGIESPGLTSAMAIADDIVKNIIKETSAG